jgi:hypothetical protein
MDVFLQENSRLSVVLEVVSFTLTSREPITTATRVDHSAEQLVAAWHSDQQPHLSHSRSALLAEPVGDGRLVPELAGTADRAKPELLVAVELVGSADGEHTAAAVLHMLAKG